MDTFEKKYNEALERAKELLLGNEHSNTIRSYFEHIFPELHESEDERIRKKCIELIKRVMPNGNNQSSESKDILDCVAYLEKQKEKKFDFELIKQAWYMEGYKDREFGKESRWIIKTGEGGPEYELNPKYGQPLAEMQKPADKEQDSIAFLEQYGYTIVPPHAPVSIVPSSEATFTEWSEEEIGHLYTLARYIKSKGYEDDGEFLEGVANKIKQLSPSWKPSEEQMDALIRCIAPLEHKYYCILSELYEQAEKDILALIESRLSEIIGDAQPNPALRAELQELIKRIKKGK